MNKTGVKLIIISILLFLVLFIFQVVNPCGVVSPACTGIDAFNIFCHMNALATGALCGFLIGLISLLFILGGIILFIAGVIKLARSK